MLAMPILATVGRAFKNMSRHVYEQRYHTDLMVSSLKRNHKGRSIDMTIAALRAFRPPCVTITTLFSSYVDYITSLAVS